MSRKILRMWSGFGSSVTMTSSGFVVMKLRTNRAITSTMAKYIVAMLKLRVLNGIRCGNYVSKIGSNQCAGKCIWIAQCDIKLYTKTLTLLLWFAPRGTETADRQRRSSECKLGLNVSRIQLALPQTYVLRPSYWRWIALSRVGGSVKNCAYNQGVTVRAYLF